MKIPSKLYVALTCLTLTIESTTAAQIYFDNFDGGTGGLNGTTPDTTTALWSTEWFVNGSSVRAAKSFTINPTITHVGFAREDGAGANFSSFELSVVPEPSVALLSGIGVLTLLRRRR